MKRYPLLVRCAVIAAVAASILVPIALTKVKVDERKLRAEGVRQQFASETSGPQVVAGPFLALACEETFQDEREIMRGGKAETISEKKIRECPTAYVPPRSLEINGQLPVDERHRGIYPIHLYRAKLRLAGDIAWPAPARPNGANTRTWRAAQLVLHVRDARGIRELRATPPDMPGAGGEANPRYAFRADLGEYTAAKAGEVLPFEISLDLIGTTTFAIVPVGDETRISLSSPWPHPSFIGAWAPDERRISPSGFEAKWRTTRHATGGQAAWERAARADKPFEWPEFAGVALFDPVNIYALSYRATEYAFLFVLFTLGALALAEALAGVRLHPVQYLLVASAVAIFFLLLLALSEHLRFGASYGVAAAACIALLTFYLRHPLGTSRRAFAFLGFFSAMYGALYVLLRSEDHALLMGSLLVFALLAVAMIATRRIDWGALSARLATQ